MNTYKYQLVKDTITKEDLFQLSDWIKLGNRLTKGELNDSFEKNGLLGMEVIMRCFLILVHRQFLQCFTQKNVLEKKII